MEPKRSGQQTPVLNDLGELPGGGEMGERVRAFDWSTTPLGPVEQWPYSLRTTVTMLLSSRYPMFLWWGPELIQIYNDGYRPSLGATKHPQALGQRGVECWPEIWPIIGPQIEAVMERGEATWNEDHLVPIYRNGRLEEVYWTYSYSPVRDESGAVGGVLVVVNESTGTVVGQRRLHTLGDLAAETGRASTAEAVCKSAVQVLAKNPHDLPYAITYLSDWDCNRAVLAGATGFEGSALTIPTGVDIQQDSDDSVLVWPIAKVARTGFPVLVEGTGAAWDALPRGPWSEPSEQALVLPITQSGQERSMGVLVAGISPRRPLDDDYQGFLQLIADRIASAVANARVLEQERERAEALAELDRAKTVFFSNVSHEFRTPLTLMLGPVEEMLAKSDSSLAYEDRAQLELVHRNSLRLLKLADTMLEFSRIEAGRIEASFEPVALAEYTSELASVFRSAIERAGLRLVVHCPPLAEPVYVDRDMWEKIVLNLLSNAFKFTLEGEIEVRLEAGDGQAVLTVRDSGVGIAEEELPHVFDRFHRVNKVRGRTHEGAGIGLALVQELVKLHGGQVYAESVQNEGSRFAVTLPLGKAHLDPQRIRPASHSKWMHSKSDAFVLDAWRWLPDGVGGGETVWAEREPTGRALLQANGQPQPPGERPRIIWADDNADMRGYVRRLLGDRFEVEAVADGQAALEAALAKQPALVLSDVMMPGRDGFDLLRALREHAQLKETPVILLSARADETALIAAMEAGADDYLTKPFNARELVARVEAAVKIARLRREANDAVRESEQRARLAVEIAQLGTWHLDPATKNVYLDERMRTIWGEPAETDVLPLATAMERIHPADRSRVAELVDAALDPTGGGQYELEYRIVWADGTVHWVSANGQALFEGQGESLRPITFIGTALDITAQKQAEGILRELNEALEQRVAERTAELDWQNQRLRQVANQLSTVEQRERRRLAKMLHDGLQQILIAGKMQLALLHPDNSSRDVLQLEKLFDEAIEICRSLTYELSPPVLHSSDLSTALQWLARWFQANHRFVVEVSIDAELPILPDNLKTFLFDAVRELIFNVVKHSGSNMAVVELRQQQMDQLIITVSDSGKGFDSSLLEQNNKILEGFGLFSIRERLSAWGGHLEVNARPGEGTRCKLSVSLADARSIHPVQASSAGNCAPTAGGSGGSRRAASERPIRLLVVDDHDVVRKGLSALLEREADFELTGQAADGLEAIKRTDELRPDIIIMDIDMPRVNGIEATRRIKKRYPEIEIIGLSLHEEEDKRDEMILAGASAYLRKGSSTESLVNTIRSLL